MWRTLRSYLSLIFSKGSLRPPGSIQQRGRWLTDTHSFSALQELMAYAFDEYARLGKERRNQRWRRGTSGRPGILAEMQALLQHYRAKLLAESSRCSRRERHESTSARFRTNRRPRNGPEPRLSSAPAPAPAPERAPTKVPEKVPEKVIAPKSSGAFFLSAVKTAEPKRCLSSYFWHTYVTDLLDRFSVGPNISAE